MNFIQKLTAIWQNVSLVQKAMLLAIVLTVGVAFTLLTYWAQQPDMGLLYSGLDPEDAGKVVDKITEKDIAYKLAAGGTTIYAPKEHIAQLRLEMAKAGLPGNSQQGYGIFDDEKIGISPFVQNVNLQRALQDEIAKSIQMIDGVGHARVHIVKPQHSLFTSQKEQTSASVVLQIKPGYKLGAANIAAITHIVAGSIEGLGSESVTVVDSQGRLLSGDSGNAMIGGAGSVADYRERVEQGLANKVEDMLTTVLGSGRAMVKVSADIDMTSSNVAKESYDEGKKVPTKEEITSESSSEGASASNGSTMKNETIVTEYAVPKTVQQTTELAGEIISLTVAAFVDLSPVEAEEGEEQAASSEPIMELAEIEEIIKRAVGPKLTEDGLKVVNVKFNRPTETLVNQASGESKLDFVAIAGQASLGIMAVCALLVLKMFSGAKQKVDASADAPQITGNQAQPAMTMAPTESFDPAALRRKVVSSLQNNPDQVKQLFSNWVTESRS